MDVSLEELVAVAGVNLAAIPLVLALRGARLRPRPHRRDAGGIVAPDDSLSREGVGRGKGGVRGVEGIGPSPSPLPGGERGRTVAG